MNKLSRRDILNMEGELSADLAQVLDFKGHSLYFPLGEEEKKTEYLEEEDVLFLPLKRQEDKELLGVFLIREPEKVGLPEKFVFLENYMGLSLEKLSLIREKQHDKVTDLLTKDYFLELLTDEINKVREVGFREEGTGLSLGLLYFFVPQFDKLSKKYGYLFAEHSMETWAKALQEKVSFNDILARVGDNAFALVVRGEFLGQGREEVQRFASELSKELSEISIPLPAKFVRGKKTSIVAKIYGGSMLFPQDFDMFQPQRDAEELAYTLVSKAKIAALKALEKNMCYMPFQSIINEGGKITQTLPDARFVINLGKEVGLREGQRFAVYSSEKIEEVPVYKGEISVSEAFEDLAIAKTLVLHDNTKPITHHDYLVRIPDYQEKARESTRQSSGILYSYSDFIHIFTALRQETGHFALSLMQVIECKEELSPKAWGQLTESIAHDLYSELKNNLCEKSKPVLASYGNGGILAFLPVEKDEAITGFYSGFATFLKEKYGCTAAVGIATYPSLNFQGVDTLENCKKALACAELLEYPHISLCDSLALTVWADKLATQGNHFEAIKEYQSALLADENNGLAWNSLGVLYAAVGKSSEARHYFEEALKRTPDDISIYYNLGGLYKAQGEWEEAKQYFDKCLELDEKPYFAFIRLGQIAEAEEQFDTAKNYYEKAVNLDSSQCTAFKHLAKLALEEKKFLQAKEFLHKALSCKGNDTGSLILLAKLYLENGEDPGLAESIVQPILARQHSQAALEVYVQALKALGKTKEAEELEQFPR